MKLFIANWKMNLTYQQELLFFQEHLAELSTWKNKLVVASSFLALAPLFAQLKDTDVGLAAQSCSEFESGPFTGQVSAASLVQTGCSYVMVGHPDERLAGVTSAQIAHKALRVLEAGMIPLIFVGETFTDHTNQTTFAALEKQLAPVKEVIGKAHTYVVYEPVWPCPPSDLSHISGVLFWLKQYMPSCALLYAGGVDETNVHLFKDLSLLSGFVLGRASLDFETLKKIVGERTRSHSDDAQA